MTKPTLSIHDLGAVMEATSPTSELGRWFMEHQLEFEQLLSKLRPQWGALAVKFAEEGLIAVPPAFWHEADTAERRLARRRAAAAARPVWQRVKRKPAKTTSRPRSAMTPTREPALIVPAPDEADDEFRPVRPTRR